MKYMSFNGSCSYAGLANLLYLEGIDVDDSDIACRIGLPYMLDREGDTYMAGFRLQSSQWFNHFLYPNGYRLIETTVNKDEVPKYLESIGPAMLGVRINETTKHAVIFTGTNDGQWYFLNNKSVHSGEPDEYVWDISELMTRLDDKTVIGRLEKTDRQSMDRNVLIEQSVIYLETLKNELTDFCQKEVPLLELQRAMNQLFRPILLDSIPMFELMGESEMIARTKAVQTNFLQVFRQKQDRIRLEERIDLEEIINIMDEWQQLMRNQLSQRKGV